MQHVFLENRRTLLLLCLLVSKSLSSADAIKDLVPLDSQSITSPSLVTIWDTANTNTLNKAVKVTPALGTNLNNLIINFNNSVQTLNSLSNTVASHTNSLGSLSNQVSGLPGVVSTLITSTENLATALNTEIAARASAVSMLTTVTTQLRNDLTSEITARTAAVSLLTTATTTLATNLTSGLSLVSTATTTIETNLANEIASRISAVSALTTTTINFEARLAGLDDQVRVLSIDNESQESDIEALEYRMLLAEDQLSTVNANLSGEVAARTSAVSMLMTATTQLRTDLANEIVGRSEAISLINTSTFILNRNAKMLSSKLTAVDERVIVLENDNQQQAIDIETLGNNVVTITQENIARDNDMQIARQRVTVLENLITEVTTTAHQLRTDLTGEVVARNAANSMIATATGILRSDLANEAFARIAAISALGTSTAVLAASLADEIVARSNAVSLIATSTMQLLYDLRDETAARTRAQSSLVAQIDNLLGQTTGLSKQLDQVQATTTVQTASIIGFQGVVQDHQEVLDDHSIRIDIVREELDNAADTIDFLRTNILPVTALGMAVVNDDIVVGQDGEDSLEELYDVKQLTMVHANIILNRPRRGLNGIVWNSMFGIEGNVSLNGQQLILASDLLFSGNTSIKTLGKIIGNDRRIVLSNRVTQLPLLTGSSDSGSFGNVTLVLNNNVNLNKSITITSDCIIDGNGFQLNLDKGVQLIIPDNVTLTLSNVTLTGAIGNPVLTADGSGIKPISYSIILSGARSAVRLENSVIIPRTDLYIDKGIVTITDNESGITPNGKSVEFGQLAKLIDMRTSIAGAVSNMASSGSVVLTADTHIQGGMGMTSLDGGGNTIYFDDMPMWPSGAAINLSLTATHIRSLSGVQAPVSSISFAPDGRYVCYVHSDTTAQSSVDITTGQGTGIVRIDAMVDQMLNGSAITRAVEVIQRNFIAAGKRDGALGWAVWRPRSAQQVEDTFVHNVALFWSNPEGDVFPCQLSQPILGQLYAFNEDRDVQRSSFMPTDNAINTYGTLPLSSIDDPAVTTVRAGCWTCDGQFLVVATAYPHTVRLYKISEQGQVVGIPGNQGGYSVIWESETPLVFKQLHCVSSLQNKLLIARENEGGYVVELLNFNGKQMTKVASSATFLEKPRIAPNPCQSVVAIVIGTDLRIFKVFETEIKDTGIMVSLVQNNNQVTRINDISWSGNGTALVISTDRGMKVLEYDPVLLSVKPLVQNVPGDNPANFGVSETKTAKFSPEGNLIARDWSDTSILGLRTHQFSKKPAGILSNATVMVKQNFTLGGDLQINDDVTLNGRSTLSVAIAPGAVITVAPGKRLTIQDVSSFGGLRGKLNVTTGKYEVSNLMLGAGASLVLDNAPLVCASDVCFTAGTVEIPSGDFMVLSPYKIEFSDTGDAKLKLCAGASIRGLNGQKPQVIIPLAAKDYADTVANDVFAKNVITGTNNMVNPSEMSVIAGQIQNFDGVRNSQQNIQGFRTAASALLSPTMIGRGGSLVFTGNNAAVNILRDQSVAIRLDGLITAPSATMFMIDSGATLSLAPSSALLITGTGYVSINDAKVSLDEGAHLEVGISSQDCVAFTITGGSFVDLNAHQASIALVCGCHTVSIRNSMLVIDEGSFEINGTGGVRCPDYTFLENLSLVNAAISGTILFHENSDQVLTKVHIQGLDLTTEPALKFENKPALRIKKTNCQGLMTLEQLYYQLCGQRLGTSNVILYEGVDGHTYVKCGTGEDNMRQLPLHSYVVRSSIDGATGREIYSVYNALAREVQLIS